MQNKSSYTILRKSTTNDKYQKLFQFKDIEVILTNYYSIPEDKINTFYSEEEILKRTKTDDLYVYILQGTLHILDDNFKIIKTLNANDYFEIKFTDASQKIKFKSTKNLKILVFNNNPLREDWINIPETIIKLDKLNSIPVNRKSFNENYLFDYLKIYESNLNNSIQGVTLESEEFIKISDYKNFKIIKAIYRENGKVNWFLKDKKPKRELKSDNSVTFILNGSMDIISKRDGTILDTLYQGDTLTSKSYEMYDNYYFISNDNLEILTFTTDASYTELYEAIINFHKASLKCQEKDMYTHLHNERVGTISMQIASKLELNEKRIESLRVASKFHDIGKVYTPDDILLKPGKLTDDEYNVMKLHAIHSYDMTKNFIDTEVCNIVVQHHERLDGSGYPYGLKEEDICLEAKIIAVADTLDAMTSDRPYRKALSFDIAMHELIKFSGIHYDKVLVRIIHDILLEEKELTKSLF